MNHKLLIGLILTGIDKQFYDLKAEEQSEYELSGCSFAVYNLQVFASFANKSFNNKETTNKLHRHHSCGSIQSGLYMIVSTGSVTITALFAKI